MHRRRAGYSGRDGGGRTRPRTEPQPSWIGHRRPMGRTRFARSSDHRDRHRRCDALPTTGSPAARARGAAAQYGSPERNARDGSCRTASRNHRRCARTASPLRRRWRPRCRKGDRQPAADPCTHAHSQDPRDQGRQVQSGRRQPLLPTACRLSRAPPWQGCGPCQSRPRRARPALALSRRQVPTMSPVTSTRLPARSTPASTSSVVDVEPKFLVMIGLQFELDAGTMLRSPLRDKVARSSIAGIGLAGDAAKSCARQ